MASVTAIPGPGPFTRPPPPMTAYDLGYRLQTSLSKLGAKSAFACGEYHAALPNFATTAGQLLYEL